MPNTNLIALGKAIPSSMPNKRRTEKSDLRLQLRNEIDKLALFLDEVKAQADCVQRAADALGDELLFDDADDAASNHGANRSGRLQR